MGYSEFDIRLPAAEGEEKLKAAVAKASGLRDFSLTI